MNDITKNLSLWIIISLIIISTLQKSKQTKKNNLIHYSNFLSDVNNNKLKKVIINGKKIKITKKNNYKYNTYIPIYDPNLLNILTLKNIKISGISNLSPNLTFSLILSWFPTLLLIILWTLLIKQIQKIGHKNTLLFGKSRAKILNKDQIKTTFNDVAGCDEAKEEVSELVEYLKTPEKFKKLGGKIPKGILMIGPPGTGKTLLAKAIAGEAKVPFFSISGSDFVEMFVGVGASRVRDMFEQAQKNSPCIIFIDEIDSVGRHRGNNYNNNDEREQTLNQMLVEMDGFDENQGIIIIAATNRPDVLDPALLRPGRFDRQVIVDLPDIKGRKEIIKIHSRKIPINKNVDVSIIARSTPGFSGADLANLVNEAALFAAKNNKNNVSMKEFEQAKDKILMGTERKSLVITDLQKEIIAYHESGHTIVSIMIPDNDPIHKVTIIPRGKSLGTTFFLPEDNLLNISKKKLESKISTLYGGRLAEEIIYGYDNLSTGSSHDIKTATSIAKNMVTKWGFSPKLGPLLYSENNNDTLLEKYDFTQKNNSEYISEIIDQETKKIIDKNYERAKNILKKNINILHIMKNKLIKYETLNSKEINSIISSSKKLN